MSDTESDEDIGLLAPQKRSAGLSALMDDDSSDDEDGSDSGFTFSVPPPEPVVEAPPPPTSGKGKKGKKSFKSKKGKKGASGGAAGDAGGLGADSVADGGAVAEVLGEVDAVGEDGQPLVAVREPAAEPTWEAMSELRSLPLLITARADEPAWELSTDDVSFRPAYMFQSLTHRFTLTNSGGTSLDFVWALQPMDGDAPVPAGGCPFSISPERGSLAPHSSTVMTLRFHPYDSGDFRYSALCQLPALAGDAGLGSIAVSGRALRPVAHFDVPPSDYLVRRDPELPGPDGLPGSLPAGTRVLSFESLGTRVKNTMRFNVVNPMNVAYEFSWTAVGAGGTHPAFRCATPRGVMVAGKAQEMVFEYTPRTVGTHESFWRFSVPEHGVSALFLVVGRVVEPKVSLDRTHINFGALLVSGTARETVHIVNMEHIPFKFAFDKAVLAGVGHAGSRQLVSLSPMSGVVPAGGRLPVELAFSPAEEKSYNFNLACVVAKKPLRLSLNVKADGFQVHDSVLLVDAAGSSGADSPRAGMVSTPVGGDDSGSVDAGALLSASGLNLADFGQVNVMETARKQVVITNGGRFNFDFSWSSSPHPMLSVSPLSGSVKSGARVVCELAFSPRAEVALHSSRLVCTVAGTQKYELAVAGRGVKPALEFSFTSHSFGPCFVAAAGGDDDEESKESVGAGGTGEARVVTLRITNNEAGSDVAFDCLFSRKPHLEVRARPTMLRPNEAAEVDILFMPREYRSYHEVVPFEINGSWVANVVITGEGVPLSVELAEPADRQVELGMLRVGQTASRTVTLLNRSRQAVGLLLEDAVEAGRGRLAAHFVELSPAAGREVVIGARNSVDITIRFSPGKRTPPFSELLLARVGDVGHAHRGRPRQLLSVAGGCAGMEVELESDLLSFRDVCLGSRLTKSLRLENVGDIGTRFTWDPRGFAPHFSISPASGFVAPHSDVKLDVTFHPSELDEDIRYERLLCAIEGAPPLQLTLTGACVPQPEDGIKKLRFETAVRQATMQSISVSNPTTSDWLLQPVIQGDGWSGSARLHVPARGKADYSLAFLPMRMATADAPAEGSLFLALPDGSAMLYELSGVAGPPAAEPDVSLSTAAKAELSFPLSVANWLRRPQSFVVTIELLGDAAESSTFLRGPERFDVPGGAARNYKMRFYAYRPGVTRARVTFTAEGSGEYRLFNLSITATAPGVYDTIRLSSIARQSTTKLITLTNPLPADVKVDWEEPRCEHPAIRLRPLRDMSGATEGSFELEYRPLLATGDDEEETRLTLSCAALGDYIFALRLSAAPAPLEPALRFRCALGQCQRQTYRFRSFSRKPCEYSAAVGQPRSFNVVASVRADAAAGWEGVEVSVEVQFEPQALGEARDLLTLTSDVGGVFQVPLFGECLPPMPQGPLTLSRGGGSKVEFKNVFDEAHDFVAVCDGDGFTASPAALHIDGKRSATVTASWDGTPGSSKLLISCPALPDMPAWVYYLRGVEDAGSRKDAGRRK
eukprot:PLAT7033.13.p2 GENE.PLAT7033.13~~PLAT7033.13.p2  ORF type:complete len:1497 (-),score=833.67 PLAT7033.13:92-4582(-)